MTPSKLTTNPSLRSRTIRRMLARPGHTVAGACGLALALLLAALPAHADPQDGKAAKPRYTMPSGRGWGVCEAYLKFLNSTPADEEPPMCDLKLGRVPGVKEPDWEVLDIEQHLPYVHQIELIIGKSEIEPEPEKDFELWQMQRKERIDKLDQKPRLRRVRLALVQGGPTETVLAYDVDTGWCTGEVKKGREGQPYIRELDLPHFFVHNLMRQRVIGERSWLRRARGELWLYGGAPYYANQSFLGDAGDNAAYVYIKRLQPIVQTRSPADVPYIDQELCRIRFDYPFHPLKIK